MKLVIELPDAFYADDATRAKVMNEYEQGSLTDKVIRGAIKDAIVLPEKFGRLIDADELEDEFRYSEDGDYCHWTLRGILSVIDDATTVLEAEVGDE